MASAADTTRLSAVKKRHAEASIDWHIGRGGTELHAAVVANTPPAAIAELTADCGYVDRDFLLHAHEDIRFLLRLLNEAFAEIRRWKPSGKRQEDQAHKQGDFAAECAMKCCDQQFRRFLQEAKDVKDLSDEIRVASAVRFLLKIDSRNELNTDAGARNRWLDLRAEFNAWKREVA